MAHRRGVTHFLNHFYFMCVLGGQIKTGPSHNVGCTERPKLNIRLRTAIRTSPVHPQLPPSELVRLRGRSSSRGALLGAMPQTEATAQTRPLFLCFTASLIGKYADVTSTLIRIPSYQDLNPCSDVEPEIHREQAATFPFSFTGILTTFRTNFFLIYR